MHGYNHEDLHSPSNNDPKNSIHISMCPITREPNFPVYVVYVA
jgi:hypothetical protein